jgi:Family of unknown function (DUF6510)
MSAVDENALDGNAIAGALHEHLGQEMTTVRATCGHCGQTSALAELVVYLRAPGAVGRCRHCESVVLVVTEARDTIRIHWSRFAPAKPRVS